MRKLLNILFLAAFLTLGLTSQAQSYVNNSVLKDGTLYKIGVVEDGVYRITYDELAAAGIDVASLNRSKISMFGNVGGILPEANDAACYDDLTEMDIIVDDKGIMFYGQGPCSWTVFGNYYKYQTNYYSDTTFYFLKIDNQLDGKRMTTRAQDEGEPLNVITSFVDRQYHEIDLHNHYHRGRKWFGETVNIDEGEMKIPFLFKNLLPDNQGFIEISFIGASVVDGTVARLKINGTQLGDDISIAKSGQYNFAVEKTISSYYNPSEETVEVELQVISNNSQSYLGLDYVNVNAWRSLSYENEQLWFSVNRITHPFIEQVKIDKVGSDAVILDVTSPLSPKIQDFVLNGDVAEFQRLFLGNNEYVLFDDADLLSVKTIKSIDNQNVHSINNAEMLIITDKVFIEQAEAIKAIHEEDEGMLSVVVFIDEIYNEFSSGSPDITGIRNFIRMVYERSSNLKYVLLLGRGTNDYKNIEGYGGNFVPPYEAYNSVNEAYAYVSDDYFGLLDEDEGEECEGKVDVAVGRIPVLTPDEADIVVGKIRRYMDAAKTMGEWRNELLMLADDKKSYETGSDSFEAFIDGQNTTVNVDKIYADAYVRQQLSDGSYCYPDATSSIINKYNEGIMMMTYVGHGGVQGLSASNLFRIKDIESLENYYKLPFVVTGTCEFSAFDDASFVSAGERLFKMENGGAIGMYTTTRPTSAPTNKSVVERFVMSTFGDDNIKNLTMGDIVYLTKQANANNSTNYISYVFFGDPALRFTYPEKKVVINEINGMPSSSRITVAPMDMVRVEGCIADANGVLDATFNGVVYPKMFDNKSTYTTLNNSGSQGNIYTFTNYSDVLYDGGFPVVNGRFSLTFWVPRSVNNQEGDAKLSFYAMDTINNMDANGFFKRIKVDGNPSVTPDLDGPEINLSWNAGHLSATLHDPQGIYHYNSVIGRDIVLQIDSRTISKTMIVNDYYEQNVGDFTSGKVEVDLESLEVGENVITMRAWDTHDNSNSASITVNITDNEEVKSMHDVVNYPNPFTESTCFTIDYDKKNVTVDVDIFIYDVTGRIVNRLEYKDLSVLNLKMDWDGHDATGNHLPAGAYIYKVCLKDTEGCEYSTSQRMIIL